MGGVRRCRTVLILWLRRHGNTVRWVSHVPVQRVIPVATRYGMGGRGPAAACRPPPSVTHESETNRCCVFGLCGGETTTCDWGEGDRASSQTESFSLSLSLFPSNGVELISMVTDHSRLLCCCFHGWEHVEGVRACSEAASLLQMSRLQLSGRSSCV